MRLNKMFLSYSYEISLLYYLPPGILIDTEDTKVAGGFYEMKSLLTIWKTKEPSLSLAFKCMSVYPFPGNETRNISSEDIFLPRGKSKKHELSEIQRMYYTHTVCSDYLYEF